MAHSICLVCCSSWVSSCEEPDHFLAIDSASRVTTEESKEASAVFDVFCEKMKVNLKDHSNQWNFSNEPLPFCQSCKEMVTYIFQLQVQLQGIQAELNSVVENVRLKMESSNESFTQSTELLESTQFDQRITNFRNALLTSNHSGSTSAETSDQSSKPSRKSTRSARKRDEYTVVKVEPSDDEASNPPGSCRDSDSEHSNWTPSVDGGSEDERTRNFKSKNKNGNRCGKQERKQDDVIAISEDGSDSNNDSDSDYASNTKKSRRTEIPSGPVPKVRIREGVSSRPVRFISRCDDGSYEYGGVRFKTIPGGFKCLVCPNRVFRSKGGMLTHIRQIHLGEKSDHYCSICGKNCDSPSALRNHETIHTETRDCLCPECGKGFKNEKNLKRHLKETHKIDLKFRCTVCLKRLKTDKELDAHMGTAHSEGQPHICVNCGRVFKIAEAMRSHEDSHKGEKFFKCYYCETHFLRNDNLKIHLSKEHGVKI